MSRMKLRTFSIAILLVSATMGMALNFSEGVLSGTSQSFDESDEITNLREGFANESNTVTSQRQEAEDVSIQTDFFFIREVWKVISTVVGGVSSIISLIGSAAGLTGLNIPSSVLALSGIIVVSVIFAVVSAARGWDV